jgi:uncharacterized membrane protein
MTHVLDYLSTLLHVLGMLLFVGGHIWFGILCRRAERQSRRSSEGFLELVLPVVANGLGVGVLLLFGSGLLKLFLWGEPGLIFLPDLYGWLMLGKLVLYMVIVGNGIWIERHYLPEVYAAGPNVALAWTHIKTRARVNLLLALVVVALGETLRFSRL